jgi:4-diphosphocytidyl-2-C-methyl-D-erythritol kinase
MNSEILLSPAKINLTLQVLKKREDGYHEIYTIYQKITLFDELEVKPQSSFELEFIAEEYIPLEKNLIFRAYKLFSEAYRIKDGFKVRVIKRIPMGAGLGGGSSNAGTFLKFLGQRFGIPKEELLSLGKKLGADVPFFIEDYFSACGFGIGEVLKPYPNFQAFYLLYYPGFKIETAWAYQALNFKGEKKPYLYSEDLPPWEDPKGLINDFKDLVYSKYPQFRDFEKSFEIVISKVLREGSPSSLTPKALPEGSLASLGMTDRAGMTDIAGMVDRAGIKDRAEMNGDTGIKGRIGLSGTGSTLFAVFEDEESASQAYDLLKNFLKGGKIYLARNLKG